MLELLVFLATVAVCFWLIQKLPSLNPEVELQPQPATGQSTKTVALPSLQMPLENDEFSTRAEVEPTKPLYSAAVQELLDDGDRLFDEGKFMLAERRYLKAAVEMPDCVHALNRLGLIYLEQTEDFADAEEAFRAAIKYDPENSYIAHNLGLTYYRQGRLNEAAQYLERAVEGGSRNPVRFSNLGMCYLALRQYGKAVSALRRALALDKGNERIKAMLDEAKQKDDQHKKMARSVSR